MSQIKPERLDPVIGLTITNLIHGERTIECRSSI